MRQSRVTDERMEKEVRDRTLRILAGEEEAGRNGRVRE